MAMLSEILVTGDSITDLISFIIDEIQFGGNDPVTATRSKQQWNARIFEVYFCIAPDSIPDDPLRFRSRIFVIQFFLLFTTHSISNGLFPFPKRHQIGLLSRSEKSHGFPYSFNK